MSGSRVANCTGYVLPRLSAPLTSWLLFSCALLQSRMLARGLGASLCHRAWHLGCTPRSSAPGAHGCWVMGDCRESRALLRAEMCPELWEGL